jgi:hypothetical protein
MIRRAPVPGAMDLLLLCDSVGDAVRPVRPSHLATVPTLMPGRYPEYPTLQMHTLSLI